MINRLWLMSVAEATGFFFALNVLILLGALLAEKVSQRLFSGAPRTPPATSRELLLASSTVVINSLISVVGWYLWRAGYLRLNRAADALTILRDTLVLLLTMDLILYILHRVAHLRWFYNWAHYLHHEFLHVRLLTLFVMHPLEALGFGVLWVITLSAFAFSTESVVIFLQLNLYFGLAAHCGFSPYPKRLARAISRLFIATPEFHLQHHRRETENLGFYTTLWDRLFRTISRPEP
ncbi:MAG: sterol desaturase family protein [Spirochaetota bacterium]